MMILLKSHHFFNIYRSFKRCNTGLPYYDFLNLKQNSRLLICDVNRCISFENVQVPESDLNKFIKHLFNAHTSGEKTQFQEILNNKLVQKLIDERIAILENIENLAELAKEDQELKNLAEEERLTNKNQLAQLDNDLINLVLEYLNEEDQNDIIFEISAGVGGQESMFFVKDLLEMYLKHILYLGYDYQIIELDKSSLGGFRHVSLMISGKGCLKKLQHEAGVHRVQRIPVTEKSGRLHTSVVSVTVLPQPSEIEVVLNPNDLKIDTMRASGAGGQHVNTTDSAVRITHLPSGIVAECQTEKSQIKNRELAMIKLRTRIYNQQLDEEQSNFNSKRKRQKGMGDRNEKIRTYNYNQDRVTDHRLSDGTLHNLKNFLGGGKTLDDLHVRLHQQLKYKLLLEILENL